MYAHITVDRKTGYVFLPEDRQAIYQPNPDGEWGLVSYVDSGGLSISAHVDEDVALLESAHACFAAELTASLLSDAEYKARMCPKGYANMMREHVALGKERNALARQIKRDRQK